VKASSETLGLMSTIRDMNKNFNSALFSDASAALGVVQRQGLGKLRHIDCNYLFVQNLNAEKVIRFVKVAGTENPADLCTKGLGGDLIAKFTKCVNSVFSDGRPSMCPTISAINVRSQCHLGCLVPSVRISFSHVLENYVSKCWNVFGNYISECCDQVSSELPIPWSPEPCKELVRGGCKHIAHPHLTFVRVVTCKVVLSFTVQADMHSVGHMCSRVSACVAACVTCVLSQR